METLHTQGTWNAVKSVAVDNFWTVEVRRNSVWYTSVVYVTLNGDQAEANARLIAAAPDLLLIVQDLANRDQFYLGSELSKKVQSALAKVYNRE